MSDVDHIARGVAWYKLQNWLEQHPEHENNFTLLSAIYRRVCLPYALVKVAKRLEGRGYRLDDINKSDRSIPRSSIRRRKDNFLRGITFTIERAAARIE